MQLIRRGARWSTRAKATTAAILSLAVAAVAVPAMAAERGPALKLTRIGIEVVVVRGVDFPKSAQVDVLASVDGGKGSAKITSSVDGTFTLGFRLPDPPWKGVVTITATSGTASAHKKVSVKDRPVGTSTTGGVGTTAPTGDGDGDGGTVPTGAGSANGGGGQDDDGTTSTSGTSAPTTKVPTTNAPTTVPATAAPAAGIAAPNGVGGGNWKLSFSDEFNGGSLDLTKWILCNPSFASSCNPYNNEEEKFNVALTGNANVKVSGGQLHLIATKDGGQVHSGMVSTGPNKFGYDQPGYKGFQFTYGYYEGRVKLPKGKGFWPSMWMLPDQGKYGAWPGSGEYDVFEIPGNDPTEYHFTAHWAGNGVCGHACTPQQATIPDSSAGFHTYGLDWEPSGLTWYFDGKKMGNTVNDAGSVKNTPFYIIANFSVGGSWGPLQGGTDGSTPFPASMDIDYLRVWQHN